MIHLSKEHYRKFRNFKTLLQSGIWPEVYLDVHTHTYVDMEQGLASSHPRPLSSYLNFYCRIPWTVYISSVEVLRKMKKKIKSKYIKSETDI